MSIDPNSVSIVHWFPKREDHKCGYCKNEAGSVSFGMWAETLTVEDYQNLIDRGWRRCGKYCYKPQMTETCCPQYTIRCAALNFKLSKSQKKVIKKLNKFLNDGVLSAANLIDTTNVSSDEFMFIKDKPTKSIDISKLDVKMAVSEDSNPKKESKQSEVMKRNHVEDAKSQCSTSKSFKQGIGADPTKPPCKKAKFLRLERKRQKSGLKESELAQKVNANEVKTLEELLNESNKAEKHKLKIVLVRSNENDETQLERILFTEFELYKKYQIAVHNDPPEKCTTKSFTRFLVTTPLKINLVRMSDDNVHYQLTAELYAKYQKSIHNDDDCDEEQFCEFLVDSPLEYVQLSDDGLGFGSFHQQYWLDDKLIAVGVIDILPTCVSSVYFFYDPDYRGLTLGTYASSREIEFTRCLNKLVPSIQYYYMGFYIHSCQKMRYKGQLSPSTLLCPETYEWFPIEKCIPKLDANKYSRLNDNLNAADADECTEDDLNSIKIIMDYHFCAYKFYHQRVKYADVFKNIAKLIGKRCAPNMLIVEPHEG